MAVSAACLLLFAPAMFAIAATTWIRSGRRVLLRQERVGRDGRRFLMCKFRSLPVEALAESDRQWVVEAPDGWGRFMRRTGLDELPQLFNVLLGDMTLVGPRPERPHFVELFRREVPSYAARHQTRPGITGWAQIHGLRGDTSIPRRVEYDLYYLQHRSMAFDFRILWTTAKIFWRLLVEPLAEARGVPDARSV